jgi:hypothetical protein
MPLADGSDPEEPIPAAQVTSTPPRYSPPRFQPYSPARPGRAPLIPAIGSSPVRGISQPSQPPTPVKGLNADELRGMPKEWNSAAKITQLVEAGVNAFKDKENVLSGEVLDWLKETFKSAVNTSILLRFAYDS